MPFPYTPGDHHYFSPDGNGEVRIPCIVVEVDEEGYPTKIKAAEGHEALCRMGFFQEGEDYVVISYEFSEN